MRVNFYILYLPPLNRKQLIIRKLGVLLGALILINFTISHKEKSEKITDEVTVKNNTTTIAVPFLQKDFIGFKEAIAFKESQGRYKIINKFGYLGKYQFGKSTLRLVKVYNTQHFLNNPKQQEKAFIALCKINKWILRKDIKRFEGKKINGIVITESGVLAAAHLAGAGSVKKYLRSYGKYKFKDGFGTSICSYLKKFGGYDVSNIIANRRARA